MQESVVRVGIEDLAPTHVAGMPLKRKLSLGPAHVPVQASEGSRFVHCPICLQRVAHYLINSHLDDECGKSTSSPADVQAVKPGCLKEPKSLERSSQQLEITGSITPRIAHP